MKKLIYSKEDLDLILAIEIQEKDKEIERLNNVINELDKWIRWKMLHCVDYECFPEETLDKLKN